MEQKDSQRLNLKIKGASRKDKRTLKGVRTVEDLKLSPQHVQKEEIEKFKYLDKIQNELLYEHKRPSLLIGQDNWDLIISRKILKGKSNEPTVSLTSLGWVLHGYCPGNAANVNFVNARPVNFITECGIEETEIIKEELEKHHINLESTEEQQRRPSDDADGRAELIETTLELVDDVMKFEQPSAPIAPQKTLEDRHGRCVGTATPANCTGNRIVRSRTANVEIGNKIERKRRKKNKGNTRLREMKKPLQQGIMTVHFAHVMDGQRKWKHKSFRWKSGCSLNGADQHLRDDKRLLPRRRRNQVLECPTQRALGGKLLATP